MSRYIDADELKGALQHYKNTEDSLYYDELEMYIDDTPAADVEEVRHGKWIITEYEYYDCSECGESYYNGCDSHAGAKRRLEINQDVYSYCPYCGAKMDKEKEEQSRGELTTKRDKKEGQ